MKVFLAGATGALGRQLVPQLVARGHEVVGMTRSASKQALLRSLGARPVGRRRARRRRGRPGGGVRRARGDRASADRAVRADSIRTRGTSSARTSP